MGASHFVGRVGGLVVREGGPRDAGDVDRFVRRRDRDGHGEREAHDGSEKTHDEHLLFSFLNKLLQNDQIDLTG